eukprot:TRINITY_DN19398_c0_g1_i1.p1 TRINITY_DN19398_c0_g1~~TRINITY_DN19398_c0_g1_i1.p1  ORF type:complete len:418 (+),score=87.84 TRINITY_DN19398_c0_g1_i1:12-1265(+)
MNLQLLLTIISLLCLVGVNGDIIISNSSIKIVPWSPDNINMTHFPTTSTLYLSSKLNNVSNISGIILYTGQPRATYSITKDFKSKLLEYQSNPHILGVIVFDAKLDPGYLAWVLPIPSFQVPVWIIGRNSIASISLTHIGYEGTTVELVGLNDNNWNVPLGGAIFWCFSLVLLNLCILFMSIFTMLVLWKTGKRFSIASICLIMEMICSLIRILELTIEWFSGHRKYQFLETLSFPFLLGASGLLVFFWLDITSGSLYNGNFLDTMKIPAFGFFIVLIINEVTLDIFNNFFELPGSRNAIYAMYATITIMTGILYFIVSYKISRILNSNTKASQLRSINLKAKICGFLMWIASFIGIILVLPGTNETMAPFHTLWYFLFLSISIISIIQITIFFPSRETISSISHSSKAKSNQQSTQ